MHASLSAGSSAPQRSVSSPSDAAAPLRTRSIDQRINIIIWSREIKVLSSMGGLLITRQFEGVFTSEAKNQYSAKQKI